MNRRLAQLISVSGCALLAAQALAQSPTPPAEKVAIPTPKSSQAPTHTAKSPTGTTLAKATAPAAAATTVVSAAGSVIVLADGIVANAAMAQIPPPAPGFVYER